MLPFSDATLRLSLPFSSQPWLLRISLIAGIVLFGLWLVMRLHRRELQSVSPRIAGILTAIRLALFSSLALIIFTDPALTRTQTETIPGLVVVALDLSDSMRVTDPDRPAVDKLRLARSLKLATDLAGDSELAGWIAAGTPRFGSDGERVRHDAVVARVDAATRLDLSRRILADQGLLTKLREKHTADFVGFSSEILPLPSDTARLEKTLTGSLSADGRPRVCTDLKLPLARAADGESETSKLLGVILFTDGRHNWGDSPLPRAVELGRRGVPVYSVAMAPRDAPPDVAIVSARAAASTVFKNSSVPVDVTVRVTGWPAGPLKVTLARPDSKQPVLMETIEHTGTDATYPINFKIKLDEPGPQRLVAGVDAGPADRFVDNNRRSVRVNVVKDRARVMLIDSEARWEFHYLHTCLGRDPNMDLRSIVFRQPRIGAVKDDELRASGSPADRLPDDLDILTGYDVIILGDVELQQMTREQRQRFEHYVGEAGGTLVISTGKRAMPLAYSEADEPLRNLLPIRNPQAFDIVEGFPVTLTPAGERSWFLAMGDTGGESRTAWDRFPLTHWCVVGDLKDGSEALATGPQGKPLVARQSFGFGRVLYVGIDSTWRWRYKAGDLYHHRFWSQIAQWAASDRLLPVSNAAGTIRFGPREPVVTGGRDVEIVLRIAESGKLLPPAARKAMKIVRLPEAAGASEATAAVVPLTPPEGRPRDLHGSVPDLLPGKYAVELDIPDWTSELAGPPGPDGRSTTLRAFFEVVPPDSEELIDLAANFTLMTEMATASGGTVLAPENAMALVNQFAEKTATRTVTLERPLRQSWLTLGLFLTLLAAGWIVRKWAGLP